MNNTGKTVAVIGAGTLGLVTAYQLAKQGCRVTVFEKSTKIGGMAEGFNLSTGERADKFYHYFCKGDKEVFSLIKELGKSEKLHFEKCSTSLNYSRKEFKEHCTASFNDVIDLLALKDVSASAKLRFLFHMAYLKFFNPLEHDRVSAVKNYEKIEGKEASSFFWKYLLHSKFMQYTGSISALYLDYRIKRVLESKSLFGGTSYGFYEGGANRLLDELYRELLKLGVKIRLNSEVRKIKAMSNSRNRVRITYLNSQSEDAKEEFFSSCAVTVPTPYLNSILDGLNAKDTNLFRNIRNCGCVCTVVELTKPFSPYFWNNLKRRSGFSGFIDYSPLKTTKANLVYIPRYMPHIENLWSRPDQEFSERAVRTLSKYMGKDNEIKAVHCFRYEYAQPVFEMKFFKKIKTMKTSLNGVYRADTTFSYPNDRCMNECIKIAKRLSALVISDDDKQ